MAQTLEKLFLSKIRDMPQDEHEVPPPPKKGVKKSSKHQINRSDSGTVTRKRTQEAQVSFLLLLFTVSICLYKIAVQLIKYLLSKDVRQKQLCFAKRF